MTSYAWIGAGFCLGGAAGFAAARDFVRAALAPSESALQTAIFGMLRRAGIFLAALLISTQLGPFAWAGAAVGYLAVFMTVSFRRGLAHGR